MKAMHRVFGYLRNKYKGQILIDTGQPAVRDTIGTTVMQEWKEFSPDAVENIPKDRPKPRGKLCIITCYVDADHARDMVSRKSMSGVLLLLNNTPVQWQSKQQKTVKSATYGSEMVAARIAVEMIIPMRYFLYMLGVNLEPGSTLVGDNMAVVLSTTIPSSVLKKKH